MFPLNDELIAVIVGAVLVWVGMAVGFLFGRAGHR
jgi:hypothetical protein